MRARLIAAAAALSMVLTWATVPGRVDARSAGLSCPTTSGHSTKVGSIPVGERPVVLVHGWTDNSGRMQPVKTGLESLSPGKYTFRSFDYRNVNTEWAAHPAIASCLAHYVHAVSKAYSDVGGDGRVLVVTHSMGGLAIRYATSPEFTDDPLTAAQLAGVVTIDAPHMGSPFGGKIGATAKQWLEYWYNHELLPERTTDGALCLALHGRDSHGRYTPLPSGCATPPYLPSGVPIAAIAGDNTIRRTLFGVNLYDIDLQSDGVVGVDSSHGYLSSGPDGVQVHGHVVLPSAATCVKTSEQTMQLLVNESPDLLGAVVRALANLSSDSSILDQLNSGQIGIHLQYMLLVAAQFYPCGHADITKNLEAIRAVNDAMTDQVALDAPHLLSVETAPVPTLAIPNYETSGRYPQVGGATGLDSVNRALREEIQNDQRNYIKQERKLYGTTLDDPSVNGPGLYDMGFEPSLMVANTTMVSTMYPSQELYPGGNDGSGWMHFTAFVSSGQQAVELDDILADGPTGLRTVASYVKKHVLAANSCVADDYYNDFFNDGSGPTYAGGFTPTWSNYQDFALTRAGIDIGLQQGQVGVEACGAIRITVPWSAVRPHLSSTGAALYEAVVAAR